MRLIHVCIFVVFGFVSINSIAQTTTGQLPAPRKVHSLYGEVFGQALYYSINYDRLLFIERHFPATVSAGISVLPIPSLITSVATPISFNGLIGKGSHHLELGIGLTPMYLRENNVKVGYPVEVEEGVYEQESYAGHSNNFFLYLTPKIGYRFQRPQGGFFGRVTFTPPIGLISHWGSMQRNDKTIPNNSLGGYTTYFQEAAFFGSPVMPWAGFSIGWTF